MNEQFILALNNVLNLALAHNTELAERSPLGRLSVEVMKNKKDLEIVSRFLVAGAKASREERAVLTGGDTGVSDLVKL